jgi:hypothetical protein
VHGFRVVRRKDVVRPTAVCEFKEDFESWSVKELSSSSEETSVRTSVGEWKMKAYSSINYDETLTTLNKKVIEFGYNSRLYLPILKNHLVEIRMKVRNKNGSGSWTVNLSSGEDKSRKSIIVQRNADWQMISLTPMKDVENNYITIELDEGGASSGSNRYIVVDDLEIWTVPRTVE